MKLQNTQNKKITVEIDLPNGTTVASLTVYLKD